MKLQSLPSEHRASTTTTLRQMSAAQLAGERMLMRALFLHLARQRSAALSLLAARELDPACPPDEAFFLIPPLLDADFEADVCGNGISKAK